MTNEKLYEVLGDINEKYVSEARVYQKAKKPIWAKWGAIAACLVLVCVVAIPFFSHNNSVTTPGIADAAPMIYVNDTLYKQSTSQTSFNELKDDFVYLGVIENFQANHPIVGSEVYQYGENIVVGIGGKYWLYENYHSTDLDGNPDGYDPLPNNQTSAEEVSEQDPAAN